MVTLPKNPALSQTGSSSVSHILKQHWKCKYISLDGLFRPTSKRKLGRLTKCIYIDKKTLHTLAAVYINRNWDLIRVTPRYFRPETVGRVVYSCVSHQCGPMSADNRKLHVACALLTSPPLFILLFLIYHHHPPHRLHRHLRRETSATPSTGGGIKGLKLISKFQTFIRGYETVLFNCNFVKH